MFLDVWPSDLPGDDQWTVGGWVPVQWPHTGDMPGGCQAVSFPCSGCCPGDWLVMYGLVVVSLSLQLFKTVEFWDFICRVLRLSQSVSPRYNHTGWLGIKHPVTYSISLSLVFSFSSLSFPYLCNTVIVIRSTDHLLIQWANQIKPNLNLKLAVSRYDLNLWKCWHVWYWLSFLYHFSTVNQMIFIYFKADMKDMIVMLTFF